MRDWYMENDSRTWVNLGEDDIAYDTDNDAWVPLGSTEGSTPYWWRFYDRSDGPSSSSYISYWPPIESRNPTTPEQEELMSRITFEKDVLLVRRHELEKCPSPDEVGFFKRREARNRVNEAQRKVDQQVQLVEKLQAELDASRDFRNRSPLRLEQIEVWDDFDDHVYERYFIFYADLGNGVIWLPKTSEDEHSYVGWALTVNCREIEVSDGFTEIRRYGIKEASDLLPLVEHFNANSKFVKRS